jgi:chromosome partitioning protein
MIAAPSLLVVAVVNHKGGTGKTTSSAYISHALHEGGRAVLAVDADPQGSLLKWEAKSAESWPFPTVGKPTTNLHRDLPGMIGSSYDAVVIDTPPRKEHGTIVTSALRVATHVIIPMAPSGVEYEEIAPVIEAVADSATYRASGEPPEVAVLLTRVVANTVTLVVFREKLDADGVPVLPGVVGNLQAFVRAYGNNIADASSTAYGDAVDYILGKRGARQ